MNVLALGDEYTRTEFQEVAGQQGSAMLQMISMSAARVAKIGLRAMFRRRSAVVNKLTEFFARLTPRTMAASFAANIMK